MVIKKLDELIDIAKASGKKTIAVAAAEDDHVLHAVHKAMEAGIVNPILIGHNEKINEIAKRDNINIAGVKIIDEPNPVISAQKAVAFCSSGDAQILMKGLVSTADFLRAVLNKEVGLRTKELLCHLGVFEIPSYHKLLALTDAAQNIEPTIDEKVKIITSCVRALNKLGIEKPKVAIVSPVEVVNPKMESTIHASMLTQMNRRGQIKNCLIDGPLAFDNAVSKEACEHKGIITDVGGDADLIVAHNIEVGNALYKAFTYLAGATIAANILGAKVPIVLTSRADSDRSKFMSIALAATY
ncbi:MAG: bifunctional enoyl-CoA hydratase/phosphate acetyltransferase [Ignavibacteria bacterium]|jgi:phosphate butyryltransferase|nr:bifunctional enoyl-CoA hydratase/phosphate acetyltransferase [Ignavibacteria bacterium]